MKKDSSIFVTGASGMVGSAVVRKLIELGYCNVITNRIDLVNQNEVDDFFDKVKPEYVFHCAGKVGGIKANNTHRAHFIYDNVMMAANVITAAHNAGVKKLLYTGSSCIYPKNCPQPIMEEYLLTGELEHTNEPYAVAKIAGIKICQAFNAQYGDNFISVMPTNAYGVGDNYDLSNCHVLPALLRKVIAAKKHNLPTVEVWGTGKALREFMYVDDMADAMVFLMLNYDSPEIINIGTGDEFTILRLVEMIKYFVKYEGGFVFNGELDGTPRKLLNSQKLYNLGWKPKVAIDTGILRTIQSLDTASW